MFQSSNHIFQVKKGAGVLIWMEEAELGLLTELEEAKDSI